MKPLQTLIDEALLLKQEERSKKERSGKWNPSSFGNCYRRQYWNRLNVPGEPLDARVLRIFAVGNLFEEFVSKLMGSDIQKQVLVEDENCKGYADFVNTVCVYDTKSQHSKGFWYMERENYDIKKEKLNNILQVCYYGWKLKKTMAALVFISKDDLCVREYYFTVADYIPLLEKELEILNGYWAKKELPPCQPRSMGGNEGKYCPYKTKCLKEFNFDCEKQGKEMRGGK